MSHLAYVLLVQHGLLLVALPGLSLIGLFPLTSPGPPWATSPGHPWATSPGPPWVTSSGPSGAISMGCTGGSFYGRPFLGRLFLWSHLFLQPKIRFICHLQIEYLLDMYHKVIIFLRTFCFLSCRVILSKEPNLQALR